jgi:hypothetical protein
MTSRHRAVMGFYIRNWRAAVFDAVEEVPHVVAGLTTVDLDDLLVKFLSLDFIHLLDRLASEPLAVYGDSAVFAFE